MLPPALKGRGAKQSSMAREIHTAADEVEKALRVYGRHFVCFGFVYLPLGRDGKPNAPPDVAFYSSVVVEMFGSWWLATAGHIIDEIERPLQKKQMEIQDFRLFDHYGTGKDREGYPVLDYVAARKFYEYDKEKGIDWGVIELDLHAVKLLKANGIIAVIEEGWTLDTKTKYEGYFMMGVPNDSHNKYPAIETRTGYTVGGKPVPSAFYIERVSRPPKSKSTYPRFVGKLSNSEGDILGMSGAPIFALSRKSYNVIAVQSTWHAKPRTTFGFYLSTIAKLLGERLGEPADFDPECAVKAYRRVINARDCAKTPKAKTEHNKTAKLLRKGWKDWQGEDSLHEMAFGEPEDCSATGVVE
jgi:hypothetical protein